MNKINDITPLPLLPLLYRLYRYTVRTVVYIRTHICFPRLVGNDG